MNCTFHPHKKAKIFRTFPIYVGFGVGFCDECTEKLSDSQKSEIMYDFLDFCYTHNIKHKIVEYSE